MIFSHFCHLWCSGPNQAAHRNVYWWRPKRWKPCHFCHNPLANMLPRPVSGLLSRRANAMGHDPKSSDLKSEFLCSLQLQLEATKLRQHQYHQGKCYPRKRDHPNWLTPIKNSEVLCLWLTCIAWAPNKKVADMCVKWLQYKHELNYCINSLITSASKDFFTLVLHFAAIQTWLLMTKVVLHSGKFTR